MKIRVATRGSKLSLIQTEELLAQIKAVEPDIRFEIVVVKTTGDLIQDKPLFQIGVKGVFEKEVNLAVLRGEADMAVHSLKDLPSDLTPGLALAGYSRRAPPNDALVSPRGYTLETLPRGAVVGTSSVRRAEFLKAARPDLEIKPLRGNVDTRVAKILSGQYDAAVMAAAGLQRLYGGAPPIPAVPLAVEDLPPPPGQGIVAAVAREEDTWLTDLLRRASDRKAAAEAAAERAFLAEVGAGCHVAVGGIARQTPAGIEFTAGYAQGGRKHLVKVYGEDPTEVGRRAARLVAQAMKKT
ncbi:hydroxymethylbilane synthase [Pyrobaculum neutrophilum]|uniref:Probable porphobilinogen deaminase n=1 Tax=Pyrobaculum neutrophilum (strain DSM 2338 / JCM 9278 / NBRC 100436 / V24Sta) TaxID=444157 RepID=HEM3_PYRNV|nr:hydroxymethylbilane synthase [Pyrobaculum neutrophilum]B1YDP0.1 RecName: Full=Probable porphobilinogen deaminase; Short=PBG; AltName: Full=Hydroxymethylbilane synthase; Short=HMBS; AltName: Full=Pre-uroporphyrinogen synthase [Pyrobaculum neutrophilum V24Sta]ACB39903.1 porphobilinogen deaminase [Pyrobaculum neutrophilum V24Sta]